MGARHAFVEFTTKEAVAEALKLDNMCPKGTDTPVKVRVAHSSLNSKFRSRDSADCPTRSIASVQIFRDSIDVNSATGNEDAPKIIDPVIIDAVIIDAVIVDAMIIALGGLPATHIKHALNLLVIAGWV